MSATRFAEIIGDKVHLRQGILAYRSPGGDPPAQKTGLRLGNTFSTTDTTQFKRAIDMTDDELAAIVAKARLTVVK